MCCSLNIQAKTVLISSFDSFGGAKANSTRIVAENLVGLFSENEKINIVHCRLRTIYYESYEELIDCIATMKTPPDYIISLGETGCLRMKYETRAKNIMKDSFGDNNGTQYSNELITVGGKSSLKLSLDLKTSVSRLSLKNRLWMGRSYNAGTFVCNNLSYLMAQNQAGFQFSFIHIPKHSCSNSRRKINRSVRVISKIIRIL